MTSVIDGPGELREDIPLKPGGKSSRLCSCDEEFFGGPKFISLAFAGLTFIITIALFVQIYYGDYQVMPHGSVATDSRECSGIGTSVLKDGGNAVDATVASAFCLAVVNPHTTGLDASGQVLIYSHQTRLNPVAIDFTSIDVESSSLPRLIIGLAYMHQKYGKLPWKRLVEPAALLAKNGFSIPHTLVTAVLNFQAVDLFGSLETGQKLFLESLGDTLDHIANLPEKDLYSAVPQEQQITETDTLIANFKNFKLYVPDSSSSALALLLNLHNIDGVQFNTNDTSKPEYIYRIAEITDNTYNHFQIAAQYFQGTSSNIAVMDMNDLYVSLVTGMYAPFGTRNRTAGGYFLDKKSSVLPTTRIPLILTDSRYVCGRRIVLGVADIAMASQIISSLVIGAQNATATLEAPRFDILGNGSIGIEDAHMPIFGDEVRDYLRTLGKVISINEPYNSCNIVEKEGDNLNSHSDSRGGGIASRF